MKPLSSVFCLNLRTAVKWVCKSFMLLVTITTTLNIYKLDYPGARRQESITALGVVALFLTLLLGSAFSGHVGADRGGLWHIFLSLALLVCAFLQWVVVGVISMQKEDIIAIHRVCLQNRCAETLWTVDFGYRVLSSDKNTTDSKNNAQKISELVSKLKDINSPHISSKNQKSNNSNTDKLHDPYDREEPEEAEIDESFDLEYQQSEKGDFDKKSNQKELPPHKSKDFWQRFTQVDEESSDPSTGISLAITLVFFLILIIYFFVCATIICSYSSELFEENKDYGDFDEEEETEVSAN